MCDFTRKDLQQPRMQHFCPWPGPKISRLRTPPYADRQRLFFCHTIFPDKIASSCRWQAKVQDCAIQALKQDLKMWPRFFVHTISGSLAPKMDV